MLCASMPFVQLLSVAFRFCSVFSLPLGHIIATNPKSRRSPTRHDPNVALQHVCVTVLDWRSNDVPTSSRGQTSQLIDFEIWGTSHFHCNVSCELWHGSWKRNNLRRYFLSTFDHERKFMFQRSRNEAILLSRIDKNFQQF